MPRLRRRDPGLSSGRDRNTKCLLCHRRKTCCWLVDHFSIGSLQQRAYGHDGYLKLQGRLGACPYDRLDRVKSHLRPNIRERCNRKQACSMTAKPASHTLNPTNAAAPLSDRFGDAVACCTCPPDRQLWPLPDGRDINVTGVGSRAPVRDQANAKRYADSASRGR